MKKISLNENDLRMMVNETVKRILKESYGATFDVDLYTLIADEMDKNGLANENEEEEAIGHLKDMYQLTFMTNKYDEAQLLNDDGMLEDIQRIPNPKYKAIAKDIYSEIKSNPDAFGAEFEEDEPDWDAMPGGHDWDVKENITINESDLRTMVKECVKRLIKEYNDYDGWLAHQEAMANPDPSPVEDSCQYISDNLFNGVADKVKEAQNFVSFLRKDHWLMKKYQKDIDHYMHVLRDSVEDEEWDEIPQTGDLWVDGLLNLDRSGDLYNFFDEVFFTNDLDTIVKELFDVGVVAHDYRDYE